MRASNLTISIPYAGCDKNCPYCVSQMTGLIKPNVDLMFRNISKVRTLASAAQVTNVLFTGKGEPCLNFKDLAFFLRKFNDFPCELQTNGILLNERLWNVQSLRTSGLDIVAISIDNINQFSQYNKLFAMIKKVGMTSRVTLNITKKIPETIRFDDIIEYCKFYNVDQLLLSNVVIPRGVGISKYTEWIANNTNPAQYDRMVEQMVTALAEEGTFLRSTEFGMKIWDYRGISVTSSDYCIQDSNKNNDIRSLIFLEDGHLYTSWASNASRIF